MRYFQSIVFQNEKRIGEGESMKFKIVIEFESDDLSTADMIKNLIDVTVDYCDLLPEGATVDLVEDEG